MMKLLLKRLAWTDQMSDEEQSLLVGSVLRVQSFAPAETIVPAEVSVNFSSVILQGMSSRQKVLENCAEDLARQCGCHDCLRGGHSSAHRTGQNISRILPRGASVLGIDAY